MGPWESLPVVYHTCEVERVLEEEDNFPTATQAVGKRRVFLQDDVEDT